MTQEEYIIHLTHVETEKLLSDFKVFQTTRWDQIPDDIYEEVMWEYEQIEKEIKRRLGINKNSS